jgi:COMPASS component SWD3
MKLLNFLKSRPVIIILAMPAAVNYAVNIIVIDVHSSTSNLPIDKSIITQSQERWFQFGFRACSEPGW